MNVGHGPSEGRWNGWNSRKLNQYSYSLDRNEKMTSFSPPPPAPSVRCDRALRGSNMPEVCQFARDNMDSVSTRFQQAFGRS